LQTQIVSTKKQSKKLSYVKAACKILVKLTPGWKSCQTLVYLASLSVTN